MSDTDSWALRLKHTLESYDESLLRRVAYRLFKRHSQQPAPELIERCLETLANAAVVDRRLREVSPSQLLLLAAIGRSRQPVWRLGNLVELLSAFGDEKGPEQVFQLFEMGLLYPELSARSAKFKTFEQWLGRAGSTPLTVFAPPSVSARAMALQSATLPTGQSVDTTAAVGPIHEADGLEWPIRLAALWQQLLSGPLRQTQQGQFFKRDLERLTTDPVLTAPPSDQLGPIADPALLATELARATGIVKKNEDGELAAGELPAKWEDGLPAVLAAFWSALSLVEGWNPQEGFRHEDSVAPGNPFSSAYLLSMLGLASIPEDAWVSPDELESWLVSHHPFWKEEGLRPSRKRSWLAGFLLGLGYSLRLVQAAKDAAGEWLVRLSPWGRWLLGLADQPATPQYPQTLLVQPNLEIVVFRQGLTPGLVARLSRFAQWQGAGPACTLEMQAQTVYRALESGETFESILSTLEQHSMRPIPPGVVDSLRTWANKRERLTIYPSATLFEFRTPQELNEALARGLAGLRVSDRLLVVADEGSIEFREFRLTGSRDYQLPPEKCVEIADDGVTLYVDLARSDLLLETELLRFAVPLDLSGANGRLAYQITPESLAACRDQGMSVSALDDWFQERTARGLSPAARLLFEGARAPVQLAKELVLRVPSEEIADGLVQWPTTRALIRDRLGATALVVAAEDLERLRASLAVLGITLPS
jgi:hypothetical protein